MPDLRRSMLAARALRFNNRVELSTLPPSNEEALRAEIRQRDETIRQRDEQIRKLVDDKRNLQAQFKAIGIPLGGAPPTWRDIAIAVMNQYNVSYTDICGPRRHGDIVWARHVFVYALMALSRRTTPTIGRRLGGRDHSTI